MSAAGCSTSQSTEKSRNDVEKFIFSNFQHQPSTTEVGIRSSEPVKRAMPVLFKMSDDKKTDDIPTVVFTETQDATPPRKTKKYVIIAVSAILGAVIILAAILVGMYMFTQAQKEIIQYTMHLSENSKQDVTSDPNENVVQYHVSSPSHDAWIVNDFNKDIQLVKVVSDGQTNCYLSALNRTNAMDPSQINGPDTAELNNAVSLMYHVSDTPIADTSFLSKTARDTCQGISVYWLYPYCSKGDVNEATNGTNVDHPKTKRQSTYNNAPYYCMNSVRYQSGYNGQRYWVPCVTGCCQKICACKITYYYSVSYGRIYCQWVLGNCPPTITPNPVYSDGSCFGPSGVSCPYARHSCGCP